MLQRHLRKVTAPFSISTFFIEYNKTVGYITGCFYIRLHFRRPTHSCVFACYPIVYLNFQNCGLFLCLKIVGLILFNELEEDSDDKTPAVGKQK